MGGRDGWDQVREIREGVPMFARGDGGGCLWWSSHLPMVRTERSCMSPAALVRSGRWMISPWGTVSSIATSPCAYKSVSHFRILTREN